MPYLRFPRYRHLIHHQELQTKKKQQHLHNLYKIIILLTNASTQILRYILLSMGIPGF